MSIIVPSRHTGIGARVNSNLYTSILYNFINFHARVLYKHRIHGKLGLQLSLLHMAAWVREEENASNQRQKKRDAEEADKVEVAPGVTVASLRRFRTALIGPTQGLPKRRRLCH